MQASLVVKQFLKNSEAETFSRPKIKALLLLYEVLAKL